MAVRPMVARGGGNGLLYGMIAFVVVSVLALGAFIWQFTLNKRIQTEADSARRQMNKYGQPPAYYADEAAARNNASVFNVMQSEMQETAKLVSGRPDDVRATLAAQAGQLLKEVAATNPDSVTSADSLFSAIRKLSSTLAEARDQQQKTQAQLAALQAENMTLSNGVKTARDEFEAQVASLKTEVDRLEKDKSAAIEAKDRQLAEQMATSTSQLEDIQKLKTESTRTGQATEIEREHMKRQIDELQGKIAQTSQRGLNINDILTKADGRILRAVPGSELVYINLGTRDHIRPGMTFEVFSPTGERSNDFRGKASIEVGAVMNDTAECRVTRSVSARPVVEGDIIVNIAFERGRKPKFLVAGEFDLDYDGNVDWDGPEKVAAIVRQWGGEVAPQLDETVDFVVIGRGPQPAAARAGQQASTIVEDLNRARSAERTAWQELINRAHSLYIPVVNQNQFLFLTGYSGEGAPGGVR